MECTKRNLIRRIKEGFLGGKYLLAASFSPNSRVTKTITQSRNPGNDIPVKGVIICGTLLVNHFLTNLRICLSL